MPYVGLEPLTGANAVTGNYTGGGTPWGGTGPATLGGVAGGGPAANALSQGQQYAGQLPTLTGQSNLQALNYDLQLANTANATNQLAQIAANQSRLGPEGTALQNQVMGNAQAGAQGVLTPSELRTMQDISAQQWGGRGFGVDNPAQYSDVMNRYLRTQYQRQQDAANTLNQLYSENPSAPIVGLQDFYMNPNQYSASTLGAANLLNQPAPTSVGTPRVGGGGGGDTYYMTQPAPAGGGGGGYPGAGFAGAPALDLEMDPYTFDNTIGAGNPGLESPEDFYNYIGGGSFAGGGMTGDEWSYLNDAGYG